MSTCTIPSNEAREVYPQARTDHEAELWARYMESRSIADRNKLVEHYRNSVADYQLRRLNHNSRLPNHLTADDFSGVVYAALIWCVERFEPARGWRFGTFATRRIQGAVQDEMRTRSRAEGYYRHGGRIAEVRSIQAMEATRSNDDDPHRTPDLLADELGAEGMELLEGEEAIEGLAKLLDNSQNPRGGELVRLYYLRGVMLREIAERLGISESRASQLHKDALQWLKGNADTLELLGLDEPPRQTNHKPAQKPARKWREPVEQLDQDGQVIARFDSMAQAAEAVGLPDASHVSRACRNKTEAGGYWWRKKAAGAHLVAVEQLDQDGQVVATFDSMAQAENRLGLKRMALYYASLKGLPVAGYWWRRVGEPMPELRPAPQPRATKPRTPRRPREARPASVQPKPQPQAKPAPAPKPRPAPKPAMADAHPGPWPKPVARLDEAGNIAAMYPSIAAAARAVGVKRGGIRQALRTNCRSHGSRWRYLNDQRQPVEPRPRTDRKLKPVAQVNELGQVVRTFKSRTEAARAMGMTDNQIGRAIQHPRRQVGGFYWRNAKPQQDEAPPEPMPDD